MRPEKGNGTQRPQRCRLNQTVMQKNMKPNTEKFFNMVMAEVSSILHFDQMKQNEELKQAIMNTLLDKEGPRSVSTNPGEKEIFVNSKLLKGFSEIHQAVRCLENIEIYTRRFPFSRTKISKLDYLKYNIENYLNEVYVLKLRMIAYSTTISRSYRKSDNGRRVETLLGDSSKYLSTALETIIHSRGSHVHSSRFSDEDLDRLSSLELMHYSNDSEARQIFESLFEEAYLSVRKKWVKLMKDNMTSINILLDKYCLVLIDAISDGEKIIYPSNTKWA